MANEFIARKGLIALEDSQITGSLDISTSLTASNISVKGTISGSRIYGSGTNQKHLLMSTNTDAITEIKPSDTRSGLQSVLLYRNNNTGTANYLMAEGPTTRFATYDGGTPSDVSGMISIIPNNTNEAPKIAIGDAGSGDAQLTIGNNILLSNTGSVDSYINAGNVGIGTTSPSAKLHVSGSNDGVHIETQVAGASAPQLFIEGNKSVGSPSAATIVELKSNLDVRGRGILYTNGADSTEWYSGVPYQGGGYQIGYDSSGGQSEYKANSSLFINTSGNVGIGTTSPTKKLTVEGNISASGDVDIVGQLSINGFSDVSASLAAAVAGGDGLGNHTATQDLNMGGNAITSVGNVDGVDISTLNSSFNTLESKTLLSGSAQIASDISGAFTAGNGISLSSGQFTVAAGTGLTQNAGGLAFDADGGTLTTNNADVDHILINDGGTFKRITKGNINVGDFNNDAGYITSYTVTSGDVTAHVGDIDHDSLLNFVANEHIDHSTITIGSGKGLSGGGTIDTNRSLTLNTGSTHFIDGAAEAINSASFSTRVTANDAKLTANTSNVQAAGAVMDSEVTDLDGIKSLTVPNSTTISTFGASLVDDANAAAARTTLGVDASGTDNSTDVTLAGSLDYITISGQEITRNSIDLSTDVTGQIATSSITDFPTEVSRSAAAAGFGAGGGGGSGTVTEVTVGTGLDVANGTTTPNITLDLSEVGFTGTANGLITSDNDGTVTTESTLTYSGTILTLDGTMRFTPGTSNNGITTRVDNQWESTTLESNGEYIQVGTAISRTQHYLYNLGSSGWVAADADATSTSAGFLGVAIDSTTDSDFLIRGVFNILATNVTDGGIGKTVYVSTSPGVYTCTAPSATGDIVRAVGHIVDTFVSGRSTYYKIYFNPSPDYIEN